MRDLTEVTVKLFAILREIAGTNVVELTLPERSTVSDVIDLLDKKYGRAFSEYVFDEEGKVRESHLIFLLNGVSITTLNGFVTVLNDRDSLAILPPVGGG